MARSCRHQSPDRRRSITDPIFSGQFVVTEVPQITTSFLAPIARPRDIERSPDSVDAHSRHPRSSRRIMVVMTHNTDIGIRGSVRARSRFFYQFSPNGYALGINVLLYAMTH
jgi:hypothetical protein